MFIKRRLFIGLLKKRRMDADGIHVKKLKAPDRHYSKVLESFKHPPRDCIMAGCYV